MCDACACKVPRKGVYAELKDCRLQEEGGKVFEVDWWWWWGSRVNQLTVLAWFICLFYYLQALGNLQSLLQLFALLLLQ